MTVAATKEHACYATAHDSRIESLAEKSSFLLLLFFGAAKKSKFNKIKNILQTIHIQFIWR